MTDDIALHSSGWYLPKGESYFAKCAAGPPKSNGFRPNDLLIALSHVRTWDIAVDVGSHVGMWCFDLAQKFKRVYAFEPAPDTYGCFIKNMSEFANVIAHNVAVGDKPGRCVMRNDGSAKRTKRINSGGAYIVPGEGEIPIVALDDMGIPGCDLLKIDVEGFEWNVLQGSAKLIKDYRPVIIMECTDDKFYSRFGIPIGQAQSLLKTLGYVETETVPMKYDKVFLPQER